MCAHGREGQTHIKICVSPFLKEFCMARLHFDELSLSAVEVTEFGVTTKRGYGCASVAVRAEKRATKSDKLTVLFSETETAKRSQKFPFHFFFRFAAEGWGEEAREKCKEIFWFLHTRVLERVRGVLVRITTQSERTIQIQATTRSARAKWVRAKANTSPPEEKSIGVMLSPNRNSGGFSPGPPLCL